MLVVVGVSHPALALRAQGSRIRAGGTTGRSTQPPCFQKWGGKKPSQNNLPWNFFLVSTSEQGRTPCQAEPRGARPRVPEVLLLDPWLQTFSLPVSTQRREEGNFCDFQLCAGPRCPGTTVVIESRWPFAVNAKLCIGNLCKSLQWIIDLCE